MYGQCLDSHILQSFSEFHDYLGILVPAEPGLYGNRFADSIDNTLGYHHHLVRLPHHSGTRSPAGDFADGTAEVNVNDIAAVPSGYLVGVIATGASSSDVFIFAMALAASRTRPSDGMNSV